MSIHDPKWKTATADKSRQPGYLKARFAKIRREQKSAEAEREKVVTPIKREKK